MRKWIDIGAQFILGLVFVVFGLNGFFEFLPVPPLSDGAGRFIGALVDTGYMMPMIKLVEVVAGLMLLFRKGAPIALVLLAPIVVNIFMFHAVLDPSGLALPVVIVLLEAYLGFVVHRSAYRELLRL